MALLEYGKASALLKKYKIKTIESRYIASAQEAVKFAAGKPIVLKGISNKAIHKTKSHLIEVNLASPKEIEAAYNRITKNAAKFKPYKILAQHMVKNGIEIIMGGRTDAQFGRLILIGLGGIYVETFKDFALRVCPITKHDAESMLNQLKSHSIIAPDKKSEEMIKNLLMDVSRMLENNSFAELDLNPLIIHDGTYDAVDIRILE